MVHTCCVYMCNHRANKGCNLTFHSFPSRTSNEEVFLAWARAINRKNDDGNLWIPPPSNHLKVCSAHFLPSDFKENTNICILKNTAVPSIFPGQPSRRINIQRLNLLKKDRHSSENKYRPWPNTPKLFLEPDHFPADEDWKPKKQKKYSPDLFDLGEIPKTFLDQVNSLGAVTEAPQTVSGNDHSYFHESQEKHIRKLENKIKGLERTLRESRAENKALKEKLRRRDQKCKKLLGNMRDAACATDLTACKNALAICKELESREQAAMDEASPLKSQITVQESSDI